MQHCHFHLYNFQIISLFVLLSPPGYQPQLRVSLAPFARLFALPLPCMGQGGCVWQLAKNLREPALSAGSQDEIISSHCV